MILGFAECRKKNGQLCDAKISENSELFRLAEHCVWWIRLVSLAAAPAADLALPVNGVAISVAVRSVPQPADESCL